VIGRPGSTLWLLAHEMRLAGRRWGRRRGGRAPNRALRLALTFALPVVLTLAVGVPLGLALRRFEVTPTPVAAAVGAFTLVTIFTLMLSQSLAAAVDALYERNDLDLLFSSPLEPRTVMTVRFLGVAASVFRVSAYFFVGPLIAIAVLGHPQFLAAVVVLFALALASAGTGLLLTAGLFRLIGPRRTRTIGQVLAALVGASIFLASQMRQILGDDRTDSTMQQVIRLARDPAYQFPGLDWPLRALIGQPLPLLAAAAIGAGIFGVANAWLGPRFAADAAAAAGVGRGGGRARNAGAAFAGGPFATTLRKELRLLARDPALITQVMLRVLYMLPLGFVLVRQAGDGADYTLPGGAAALVLVASQVAGSLAWITVSAEDAPDLLASAPAHVSLVRRAKLAAAALPVAALLTPILIPLILLAPLPGFAAAVGCAAAVAATGLINVWWQRPAKRSEFRSRRPASWFVTVAEIFVAMLIGAATGLFAGGLVWFAPIPAALAGAVLFALRRTDAQIAETLAAA